MKRTTGASAISILRIQLFNMVNSNFYRIIFKLRSYNEFWASGWMNLLTELTWWHWRLTRCDQSSGGRTTFQVGHGGCSYVTLRQHPSLLCVGASGSCKPETNHCVIRTTMAVSSCTLSLHSICFAYTMHQDHALFRLPPNHL